MSQLATIDPTRVDIAYWSDSIVFAARVAEKVSDTEFVPTALRGRPEAVAATILYGLEVGITPMQALGGIHIVEGRPAPSAELMRALILRAGHALTVHEMSGTRARVSGVRKGRPESERVVVEWTLDMARAAGLLGRRNWQNYPRAMLVARATGDLARLLFADVVKGLGYVAEDASVTELETWSPDRTDTSKQRPRRALQRAPRPATPRVDEDVAETSASLTDAPIAPDDPPDVGAEEQARTGVMGEGRPSGPPPIEDVPLPAMPEMEPEPSSPEPPIKPPATISAGPLKAVHANLTRELGTAATREEKHALLAAIVGREIDSSRELTRQEGYRVLDYMDRFTNGAAMWQWEPQGGITIHDLRDEPSDDYSPG